MRKKEKIMLSIIIGIALIAIVIIIAPVQDIIGQAMKAMSVQSSQQQTAANSNTYNAHNIITTAECNDHEDNEGDSFIDLGGCDCDGDRKIETGLGSGSALRVSLCESQPGTTVSRYTAWCQNQAGIWYDKDDDCLDKNDNSESIKHIILLVSDSLRAESLGSYGYERDTSPNIDTFASESARFSNDISAARWTLESFTSILSSLPTATHKAAQSVPLDECWVTLPEVLKDEGYTTVAFSNGASFAGSFYQGQGFDEFYSDGGDNEEEENEKVFDWLDDNKNKNFFMMIHYMSPHSPYDAPEPYKEQFLNDAYYQEDNYPRASICQDASGGEQLGCISQDVAENGETDIDYYVAKYDGEISYMDSEFQRLLEKLDELGIKDDTLIIFTGDHGEIFAKHDWYLAHSWFYDDDIHVPLIIRYPSLISPQIVDNLVQSIDIMPTILEMINAEGPSTMQGRSLLPLVKGERWTEQEYTISGEQDITGVIRTEEWKLIKNMNSDEEVELYNIQSDPEELTNLANENPTKLSELSEQLENIIEIYGSLSCNSNLDKQSLSGIKDGPRISVYVDEIYDFETNDWKDFFEGGNINPSEGPGWYVSDEEGNSCTEEENCILEGYQETNLVTINSYIEIDSINVNLNMINEELKIGILDEDEEKYYFNFNDGSISLFQVNQKPKQTTVRIEDEDYTFDRDTWYEVSIEIEDNQITLTINGDIIIEKTISSLGDDIKIKLETIDSTHIMIDDLSISGKKYLS